VQEGMKTIILLTLLYATVYCYQTQVTGVIDTNLQNNYFEQRPTWQNWIGADGTWSVDLGFGRVLFGFQDSWLGTVQNNVRLRSGFVRNSVAKSSTNAGNPSDSLHFSWRNNGADTSIFRSIDNNHVDWPGGAVLSNGKLHVFAMTVPSDSLTQTHYGWHCITNPYDDPLNWKDISSHTPYNGVAWNRAIGKRDGYVYVLGGRAAPDGNGYNEKAVMSRYLESDISNCNYDKRVCWGHAFGIPAWTSDCSKDNLVPIYDIPSETTLDYNEFLQKWVSWRIVFGGQQIDIGVADAPQGPWNFWKAWDYPDFVKKAQLWGTYHPKAHVMFSKTSHDMLLTFATNTKGDDSGWDIIAHNPWIYTPFPVRMNFTTTLNFQNQAKAGRYNIIAKTSQMALSRDQNGNANQFYPFLNTVWDVKDFGAGRFSISKDGKFLAIQDRKIVFNSQPFAWKIIPTSDENNYYIVSGDGTLALDNGCHIHENASVGTNVFWNVQYPCQKWTLAG